MFLNIVIRINAHKLLFVIDMWSPLRSWWQSRNRCLVRFFNSVAANLMIKKVTFRSLQVCLLTRFFPSVAGSKAQNYYERKGCRYHKKAKELEKSYPAIHVKFYGPIFSIYAKR